MTLLDDFFLRAAIAGVLVALAAAPLGCFVVWRRMAYFGDATAHAAILGVAVSLGFGISIIAGVLAVAVTVAVLVWSVTERGMASDTALGVLSHSALAIGVVAVSLLPGVRLDLTAYLFGDILAVRRGDLVVIGLGANLVGGIIWLRWSRLLTATLNEELARASGIAPARESLILTLLLAVVVAVSIKVVGALLISALMIIPAATARPLAGTPESMVLVAGAVGTAVALGGLHAAFELDTPAGPTIVCAAAILFAAVHLLALLRGRH